MKLKKPEGADAMLSVTADVLDDAMQVDTGRLEGEAARAAWEEFRRSVVKGIQIQFLFKRDA